MAEKVGAVLVVGAGIDVIKKSTYENIKSREAKYEGEVIL